MVTIPIKPLSANEAWEGRRFKTSKYLVFAKHMNLLLPNNINVPKDTKLKITLHFGLSSQNADGDNCIKQCQDIISAKYQFNDKYIFRWDVEKFIVPKGQEYIRFNIEEYG